MKIAILGYIVPSMEPWDPSNTKLGLPGSEECVVYASQELANRNYNVDVYMNPPKDSPWSKSGSNPLWHHVDHFTSDDNKEIYDLVIMWRRYDVNIGQLRGKKVFFWGHDTPALHQKLLYPPFDGSLILSNHHLNQFLHAFHEFSKVPYTICGNGIIPEQFDNPMQFTNPFSVGYFSNYSRGLTILLEIWPEIKEEFPTATLDIYYGKETWGTMTPQRVAWLMNSLGEMKVLGVTEHGRVGHDELARAMQSTSIWAYPCHVFSETYCITSIKCHAAGCIPVTSRNGALRETVHPDAPGIPSITCYEDIPLYKAELLNTLRKIRDHDTTNERKKYIEFGRQRDWKRCVDYWIALYNRVTK